MDLKTAIFGDHELTIWVASIIWAFIGALIVKVKYLPKNLTWEQFSFKKWLNENVFDFVKAISYAVIILRLGDVAIQLFEYYSGDKIPFQVTDFVMFVMFVSIYIQVKLHNNKKIIK